MGYSEYDPSEEEIKNAIDFIARNKSEDLASDSISKLKKKLKDLNY